MKRCLLVIAISLFCYSSEASALFIYYQKTVVWRFTPAVDATHYRIEILYSTENDFQTLIENLPPDVVVEDGKTRVKFDVTMQKTTIYQIRVVAVGADGAESKSLVSGDVEHRIDPGKPEPATPPDEIVDE